MGWSKQQLEELLTSIPAAEEGGLKIQRLKSCTGEASVALAGYMLVAERWPFVCTRNACLVALLSSRP